MASPIWEVVGGSTQGGVLVRESHETSSTACAERLSTGALVRELTLREERLQYALLLGAGPASGWVSIKLKDKALLVRNDKPLWRVVGGSANGGILAREQRDANSLQLPDRLSTGAVVKELALEDGRLHYQRVTGTGPSTGWVSLKMKERDLLVRAEDSLQASKASTVPAAPVSSPPKQMRVLAMAGSLTCFEVMQFTCMQLKMAVGKDKAYWDFQEGSHHHPWAMIDYMPVSDLEKQFLKKRKVITSWYEDIYHCDKDRPTIEKQFDPEVRVESVDIPEKVRMLKAYIAEKGPFDVIVAFSQAAIMMHYLIGHMRKENETMPWNLSVFFEGMHIRDKQYFDLFEKKSPHPTIHIFGKASDYYTYSREGWCGHKPVEEYYENPLVFTHEEGHQFPFQQPRAKEIYEAVAAEMWKHCSSTESK